MLYFWMCESTSKHCREHQIHENIYCVEAEKTTLQFRPLILITAKTLTTNPRCSSLDQTDPPFSRNPLWYSSRTYFVHLIYIPTSRWILTYPTIRGLTIRSVPWDMDLTIVHLLIAPFIQNVRGWTGVETVGLNEQTCSNDAQVIEVKNTVIS